MSRWKPVQRICSLQAELPRAMGDFGLVLRRLERSHGPQIHRVPLLVKDRHRLQQHLKTFARPKQGRHAKRPDAARRRSLGQRFERRHAVVDHRNPLRVESLAGHVLGNRFRNGDDAGDAVQTEPFDRCR